MKANFYILAIVAINQIFSFQSSSGAFTVELNEDENAQVKEKAEEVGNFLSLKNITKLPAQNRKTSKTIKECYDENKDNYEAMIKFLISQITHVGNDMKEALNGRYSEQVNAVQEQLKEIAELLQKYPKSLSDQLNNLKRASKNINQNSFAIRKYVERFYVALIDLEKAEKTKVDAAMNNFKVTLEEMEAVCANTVQQIKICLGETEPFVPIIHLNNPN